VTEPSALGAQPSPMVRRAVALGENVVVKTQDPEASRRERLHTLAGLAVGVQTGRFRVPRIVSFDDLRGEIVFERLPLTDVRAALSDPARSFDLVGRAAGALAAIHGHMELGPSARKAPAGLFGASPERKFVPLHGDFGVRNTLVLAPSNHVVVIDWANADWAGVDADLGPPEIDIGVFLITLFHRRAFGPFPVPRRRDLARHFLATYADGAPYGIHLGTLNAIVATLAPVHQRLTRRLRGRLRALGYRHGMLDLRLFLRGFARDCARNLGHPHIG
jgi:hypothetical protein